MSQNQSTPAKTTKPAKPTGGGATSKGQSSRKSMPISRLQSSAGNQAVSGIVPVQRLISEKLDKSPLDERDEDQFLRILGETLSGTGSNNMAIANLLKRGSSVGTEHGDHTEGDGEKADAAAGGGKPGQTGDSKRPSYTMQQKQERVAKYEAQQLKEKQVAAGTYEKTEEDELDEKLKEIDKAEDAKKKQKARDDKGAKLALLDKQLNHPEQLTEEEKATLKKEEADAAADRKLKKLEAEQKKRADRQEQAEQEAETATEWAALSKPDAFKGYGEMPGDTQKAYDKGNDEYKKKLAEAGTNQVDQVTSGNQVSKKRRLWNSLRV